MTEFEKAREFARAAHGEQQYDGRPYVENHLDRVVIALIRFGEGYGPLLIAAELHDVLEDTATTYAEVSQAFGEYIAAVVDRVTDQTVGKNRAERQRLTYERMRPCEEDNVFVRLAKQDARKLKLADRIANVEAGLRAEGKSLFGMYRKEHPFFRAMLHVPGENEEMWQYLDTLMTRDWKVGA